MGVVYKAHHPNLKEMIVAVKTISASLDSTPEIRQRFRVEAQSAALLQHENIIQIKDYDEYNGKAYLVLEYLEGADLKAEFQKIKQKQRPPFPLGQSLQIMLGVCRGLSHAHEKGIYHRDIKPANIFLTNSGQVKILDFGLAKIVSDQVTVTGAQMGTVAYMSPEQIDGKPIDQRSDIFSTGVLFYELLTYCQPFTGESWSEILFKIINTEPKPIESINKLIPPELSAIVTRAMAKDRAKRFQRMREFLESLEHFGQELEVRKRELQSEAKDAIGRLANLIEENQDLLKERAAQLQEVKQDPPTILLKLGVAGNPGESERRAGFTLDYWEMAEICEKAKQEYKQLNSIVRKREHFDSLLSEARILVQRGDFVRALETVESILHDVPSHQQALAIKEQISSRIRETKSEAKKQERAEEFLKLAESSFVADDFTGCIAFSAEVLKLVPNHKQAILLLERAQQGIKERAQREEVRRTAEKELAEARDALVARKYEQARAAAGKALDLCPDLQEASDLLSEINEAEQRYREEAARQRRIADLLLEARGLQESGKLGVALDRIKEILAIEPDHHSAIALKDKVAELLRAQQRSDELFKMAAEKYADDDLTECFPLLTEALKLRPGHPSALALLEHAKQKVKERAERQEKRRQAMAALEHARALLTREDLQSALHEVEAIKTEFPDTPGLSVLLDEIQRAGAELRIKNELEQKIAELLHTATSHLQAGQEDLALEVLNQIQSMAPDNPKAAALAREINEKRQARERELRERRERISQLFSQAQEAERSQDLKKAGELAETILAQEITHSGARDLIARVEAEIIRRQRQEEEQRQKIAELLKTVSEAESAGQLEKAIHAMDGILAIDSRRKDIVELRRKMQAQLESERARKARQAEAEQQKQIGLQLLERARFREGLASLQNAQKILTDDREILAAIARAEEGIRAEELLLKIQSGIANARKALAQENYAEATEQVNKVLILDPGNAEAKELQVLIDQAYKEQQTREKTAAYLAASRQALSNENFLEATRLASQALRLERGNAEACELVEKIDRARQQKATREKIASLLARSNQALSSEDFEEADTRAREVLLLDSQNTEAKELVQRIQAAHDHWHVKKKVASLVAEARGNWGRGQLETAVPQLEEALRLDPENTTVDSLLKKVEEDIRSQVEKQKKDRIEELLDQARQEKAASNFSEAIRILDEALSTDNSRRDIKDLRRQIIAELDADKVRQIRIAEAEREKQQGLKMLAQKRYQESLSPLNRAKEVLGAQADLEAAITEAEAGLKAVELHSRIQTDLADARQALRKEDLNKAAELANTVLYVDPQNAAAQELLKNIDQVRGEKEKRERTAELLSSSRQAMRSEEFEKAVNLASQVLVLDPQNADARDLLKRIEGMQEEKQRRTKLAALLAQSNDALGSHRFGNAETFLREILSLDPQNAEANGLLQQIKKAKDKLHVEKQITELLVEAHNAREQKQFEIALDGIARILELDPKHKEAQRLAKTIEKERQVFEKQKLRQAKTAHMESSTAADATVLLSKPKVSILGILRLLGIFLLFLAPCVLLYYYWGRPDDSSYLRPAQTSFEKGNYRTAKELLEKLLRESPENAKARKMLGETNALLSWLNAYELAKNEGNYSRAAEALQKISRANAEDPNVPQHWHNLDEIFSQDFQDTFLAGLGSWTAPTTWEVAQKKLLVREGVGLIKGRHYKDCEVDFNIQFGHGDAASWILRASDDKKNYYLFTLKKKGNPANSISGYIVADAKVEKTILGPIEVGFPLDEPNAQFTIGVKTQGTKITLNISSATSPDPHNYEAYDDRYAGGTFGFAAEKNVDFYVIGPLNVVYHSDNSLKK
jgi:serine/threonine protein kinase